MVLGAVLACNFCTLVCYRVGGDMLFGQTFPPTSTLGVRLTLFSMWKKKRKKKEKKNGVRLSGHDERFLSPKTFRLIL